MKFLISEYDRKLTINFHITDILNYLVANNSDYVFFDLNEMFMNCDNEELLKNFFINKYKTIPKCIITFSNIGSFFQHYKIIIKVTKLVFIVEDIHHGKSVKKFRIPVIKNSSIIFANYSYIFTKYGLPLPQKLIFFPHSTRWIAKPKSNPIAKILISGRINDAYPDRQYVHSLSIQPEYSEYFSTLKCTFSYNESTDNCICGKKYIEYLNNYLCAFVETSRDYILAKTFEICGSGCLLLCMNTNVKNIMENIGFIDGENYISCTRDNIIEKVKWILNNDNRVLIDIIRINGYNLIKSNHTWKSRLNLFEDIINNTFKISSNNNLSQYYNTNINKNITEKMILINDDDYTYSSINNNIEKYNIKFNTDNKILIDDKIYTNYSINDIIENSKYISNKDNKILINNK